MGHLICFGKGLSNLKEDEWLYVGQNEGSNFVYIVGGNLWLQSSNPWRCWNYSLRIPAAVVEQVLRTYPEKKLSRFLELEETN